MKRKKELIAFFVDDWLGKETSFVFEDTTTQTDSLKGNCSFFPSSSVYRNGLCFFLSVWEKIRENFFHQPVLLVAPRECYWRKRSEWMSEQSIRKRKIISWWTGNRTGCLAKENKSWREDFWNFTRAQNKNNYMSGEKNYVCLLSKPSEEKSPSF